MDELPTRELTAKEKESVVKLIEWIFDNESVLKNIHRKFSTDSYVYYPKIKKKGGYNVY